MPKHLFLQLVALFALFCSAQAQPCNCSSASNSVNLLTNGDFEDPATTATPPNFIGFESDYSATAPVGNYGIFRHTTNAGTILNGWCNTPGTNDYLIFDGTTGADAAVPPYDALRYENIPVSPGVTYRIAIDGMNLWPSAPFADITISVNGTILGTFNLNNTCTWLTHDYCWTANTSLATLTISAGVGSLTSRDFALDNAFFGTCEKTINEYAAVIDYNPCSNGLLVDDATPFSAGDTVLMIQMKGALVDTTNTASFGNVLDYNGAGNYEFNIVEAVNGNVVELVYGVQRFYDFAKGKVQLVTVPSYQNYTVDELHTCMPWNGTKGGVFVINVVNILTLNAKIDVSGRGFRGGESNGGTTYSCDYPNYFYDVATNFGGIKGEGFTQVGSDKMRGIGKLANGGGGGNNTNAGGGGGGNGGIGGVGGRQWQNCNTALLLGGIGGGTPAYTAASNTLFMGGGGGAGHENNADTDPGGDGGGIAIVLAGNIVGTDAIVSNGTHCIDVNALPPSSGDGQSGGGAGGTVLLKATVVSGTPTLSAKGGNGGNVHASALHGPGGGGGGGAILFAGATVPAGQINLSGGINGVNLGGNAHFAAPGQNGVTAAGYQVTFPVDSFENNFDVDFKDSLIACKTVQFTDLTTPVGAIASWSWKFGDGGTSAQQNPVHTYIIDGSFVVTLKVTDTTGCTDSVSKQVMLQSLDYVVDDSVTGCKEMRFTAVHNSGGIANGFHWLFGDGDTLSGNPVLHTYDNAGSYTVQLVLWDSLGCRDTAVAAIFVDDVDAAFTIVDDTICQGDIVVFQNNSSSNVTFYGWTLGDGAIDSSISPVHQYPIAGEYPVQLVVGNGSGCLDSAQGTIIVDTITTVDFVTSDSLLCEGKQVVFNADYFGLGAGVGFEWDFGSGVAIAGQNPAGYAFDTSGVFSIALTVHFRACPDASVTKNIVIAPFPRIDLGPDTSICPGGQAISLGDNINAFNPGASWLWNTGETTSSIAARHPGIYSVRVDLNGCSTDDSMELFKDCYIDIPNVFTPNGDGMNEYFIPRQLLSAGLTAFKMTIYNRWGQEIFQTERIDGRGWDGKFNDKDQPVGVYVYLIEAVFKNGAAEHYQGNVTLLR